MRNTCYQNIVTFIQLIAISLILHACGSENLGNKDTMQRDGDNDPTRTENDGRLSDTTTKRNDDSGPNMPGSSEDGVRVETTNFGQQQWAEVKQSLQLKEQTPADGSFPGQAGEDFAVGSWQEAENGRYQIVYSYGSEGDLWLRLRHEESDNNANTSTGQEVRFLTKQEAERMQLSNAWVEMVRTARQLEGQLNDGTQQQTDRRNDPRGN
jgi:hypothetical protein